MKNLWSKNPRLSLQYDVSASFFAKNGDEVPTLSKAEKGDLSIDLRKGAVIAAIGLLICLLCKLRRLVRKKRKKK